MLWNGIFAREVGIHCGLEHKTTNVVIKEYFTCLTNHTVWHAENEEGPRFVWFSFAFLVLKQV
jgi:hypothetical protein